MRHHAADTLGFDQHGALVQGRSRYTALQVSLLLTKATRPISTALGLFLLLRVAWTLASYIRTRLWRRCRKIPVESRGSIVIGQILELALFSRGVKREDGKCQAPRGRIWSLILICELEKSPPTTTSCFLGTPHQGENLIHTADFPPFESHACRMLAGPCVYQGMGCHCSEVASRNISATSRARAPELSLWTPSSFAMYKYSEFINDGRVRRRVYISFNWILRESS